LASEVNVTIPAYLPELDGEEEEEIERLLREFGNARRRAYNMIRKGLARGEILEILQRDTELGSWWVRNAYESVKGLPDNVTFGGIKNQKLREEGEISKEEFHRGRNCVLISKGVERYDGNLLTRIVEKDGRLCLRIRIGNHKWIYPRIFVPRKYLKKYGHLLDGSKPYKVVIARKGDHSKEYEVRITVHPEVELTERDRIMALDINSGHVDWAVVEKESKALVETGRLDTSDIQNASSNKGENLLYELANKIGNIAEHYEAEVIAGSLSTSNFNSPSSKANRSVRSMPQFKLRHILSYKLPLRGIPFKERSEAYTTILGRYLCKPLGLDAHKGSAYAFGIKVLDRKLFSNLRGLLSDGGDGSPGGEGESGGCVPTGLVQFLALHGYDGLGNPGEIPGATPRFMVGADLEERPSPISEEV